MPVFEQNGNIEQELISMKHKITTAEDNMIFDEILMMQRILARRTPDLQRIRNDIKEANEKTLADWRSIRNKLQTFSELLDTETTGLLDLSNDTDEVFVDNSITE